ncbi:polyadenylate-binding protein-interacting protein 2B-like [Orussus abietinus]|uniref:polyadenylate-binding protein-interacting protein 2B-like n=1 Tax=Orussus abietinus TaxID=222816 RepID=UPI0006256A4D|nr:polyadenylate-binding protein-interacting protein 2B-like [Orussus abietinus]XP_012281671.1 polyadenylate-binding protein-interacting protein 2B-like [Orussus abietinus]XP_012281672.1 polyadenylate-binding protein-interacting protein 2B-like [Orussus abietinus]
MKMKIPNSGSGNGYYGHENGVISYLDNVEADTDVQAAGDNDFSEYMWMENEEEFDKQVLQQLEEEELMEECLEAMLEEERQHQRNQTSTAWSTATTATDSNGTDLCQQLGGLQVHDDIAKQVILLIRLAVTSIRLQWFMVIIPWSSGQNHMLHYNLSFMT